MLPASLFCWPLRVPPSITFSYYLLILLVPCTELACHGKKTHQSLRESPMKKSFLCFPSLLAILLLGLGCPAETCENDAQQCSGTQIQTCVDGAWSDPVDCDAGQSCMEMGGMQHCMDGMGDDDDSAM